jgi:hypothetical protein
MTWQRVAKQIREFLLQTEHHPQARGTQGNQRLIFAVVETFSAVGAFDRWRATEDVRAMDGLDRPPA